MNSHHARASSFESSNSCLRRADGPSKQAGRLGSVFKSGLFTSMLFWPPPLPLLCLSALLPFRTPASLPCLSQALSCPRTSAHTTACWDSLLFSPGWLLLQLHFSGCHLLKETFCDYPIQNWVPSHFFSQCLDIFVHRPPYTIYNYLVNCTVTAGPLPITHLRGEAPGLFIHHLKSAFG